METFKAPAFPTGCPTCTPRPGLNVFFAHHQVSRESLVGVIDKQLPWIACLTSYSATGGINQVTFFYAEVERLCKFSRVGLPLCLFSIFHG